MNINPEDKFLNGFICNKKRLKIGKIPSNFVKKLNISYSEFSNKVWIFLFKKLKDITMIRVYFNYNACLVYNH